MKSTELRSVTLKGRCIGSATTVKFTRHSDGHWKVVIACGKRRHAEYLDKTCKPCWTIAVSLIEKLWKPSKKPRRPPAPEPKTPPILKICG